jgi:hypothetical protein
MSRHASRIERLEAKSGDRQARTRFLWKDLLDPEAAAATDQEAARLSALGYYVIVAHWTKSDPQLGDEAGETGMLPR